MKNLSRDMLIAVEIKPLFKLFLKRIWFRSFDDYMEIFGDDLEKRNECVEWFFETYPDYKTNFNSITNKSWKD